MTIVTYSGKKVVDIISLYHEELDNTMYIIYTIQEGNKNIQVSIPLAIVSHILN